MDQDQIIESVKKTYDRLGRKLEHLTMMKDAGVGVDVIESIMLEATAEGEKLSLMLRALPTYTPVIYACDDVDEVIKEIWPVQCEYTEEGWFKLTIPYLLPKKESGGIEFLRRPLYLILDDFFRKRPVLRLHEAVIAYRHVYTKDYPRRLMRDHDNIETNAISDVLAMFLMPSDKPVCLSHFETSDVGDYEVTEVYVMQPHEFPSWIVMHKSTMLYKTPRSKFDLGRRQKTTCDTHNRYKEGVIKS